jgi:hypothetical protein
MIDNRNHAKDKLFKKIKDELFCVGILSKELKGINTIIPSVLSLLTRINFKYEDKIDLTLFNADDDTRRNDLKVLSNLVNIENIINSFGSLISPYAYNPKVREEADYAAVMKRLYDKICKYALILEDDAIATYSWYKKTVESIENLNNLNENWFCLKLFTSFQLLDWLRNNESIIRSLIFICIFAVIQCLGLNYLLKFN